MTRRKVLPILTFACLAAGLSAGSQSRLVVKHETALLEPVKGGIIYRFVTCENGSTIVVNSDGDVSVVNAGGELVLERREERLVNTTALTCSDGRVYASTDGTLKVFTLSDGGELEFERSFWIAGGPTRLLVTPNGELYVVGLARVAGKHTYLRRYRLSDGEFLGNPAVDLPVTMSRGFNGLATNGGAFWHHGNSEAVYFPANPPGFWRFDSQGRGRGIGAPSGLNFRPADDEREVVIGRVDLHRHDWIRNAVSLPDGRIVIQVMPGRERDRAPERDAYIAHLAVLDSDFQVVEDNLRHDFAGLLSGADAEGNLYFVDLLVNSAGKVVKVGLTPN